jgi:glutamine synthetase
LKPKAVLAYCREKGIKAFDLRFTDLAGEWRHITFPLSGLTEASFEEGFGHSLALAPLPVSGREYSILVPQSEANYLDPFTTQPTLVLLASVQDPVMRDESPFDCRQLAVRATRYLESSSVGDAVSVRSTVPFRCSRAASSTTVTSSLVSTNAASDDSYLACGHNDEDFVMRCDISDMAQESGVSLDRHFCDQTGNSTITLKSSGLIECCDDILMLRYLIGRQASKLGRNVDAIGLWNSCQWNITRNGDSILVGTSHRGLSDTGLHALGGLLKHADTIAAVALFAHPKQQTYEWLRMCSSDVAESVCRIAVASHNPRSRSIEFLGTPAIANPYLVYSAVLMALIDGIQNKISPAKWLEVTSKPGWDRKSFSIPESDDGRVDRTRLIGCLDEDRDFLIRGEVFAESLIDLMMSHLQCT